MLLNRSCPAVSLGNSSENQFSDHQGSQLHILVQILAVDFSTLGDRIQGYSPLSLTGGEEKVRLTIRRHKVYLCMD